MRTVIHLDATLPESLRDDPSIEVLDLTLGAIRELPDWVWDLPNLETVRAPGSQLGCIGPAIARAPSLEALELHNCDQLTLVSDAVAEVSTLREIWLGPALEAVPRLPPNVSELYLGGRFESLPDDFAEYDRLTFLAITGTPLRRLPEGLGELRNLAYLLLRDCALTELPASMMSMRRKLRLCDVRGNAIDRAAFANVEAHFREQGKDLGARFPFRFDSEAVAFAEPLVMKPITLDVPGDDGIVVANATLGAYAQHEDGFDSDDAVRVASTGPWFGFMSDGGRLQITGIDPRDAPVLRRATVRLHVRGALEVGPIPRLVRGDWVRVDAIPKGKYLVEIQRLLHPDLDYRLVLAPVSSFKNVPKDRGQADMGGVIELGASSNRSAIRLRKDGQLQGFRLVETLMDEFVTTVEQLSLGETAEFAHGHRDNRGTYEMVGWI
jgi:hypothetical protein